MTEKTAKQEADETAVRDKIASFEEPHCTMATRVHQAIIGSVPELRPRLWYGMPAYARSGPVLCFFRVDDGLMSFGITEKANLTFEEGASHKLMPSSWFITELDDATEERIAGIVHDATG